MKLTRLLAPALGATLVAASAGTAMAAPDGPQRLRGMDDRSFDVVVTGGEALGLPESFPNCYTFEADGTWIDPQFPDADNPVPGTWEQHRVGATTGYSASASAFGGVVTLEQSGRVTPAGGRGVLQLEAVSTVSFGGNVAATLESVGSEVDSC